MNDVWVLSRFNRKDEEGAIWETEVHSVHSSSEIGRAQVPMVLKWTKERDDGSSFITDIMLAGRDIQICYKLEQFTVDE
jgi:hypothetical protein